MSSEDGEITDDELIISNGSTNIKDVFNNDIQNESENIKEVFNNDSTNIEMGEWDDTELIETWNLALKEYNKHFSIDPKIRQKSKQTKTSNLKHQLNDYINSNQSKINQTDKIKDEKPTQNLKRKHSEDDNSIKDKVQLNNHVKVTENIIPKVQDMKKDSNNQPELVNNEPNSQSNVYIVVFIVVCSCTV
ncbi:hypothetical protein HDV02_001083 [Globomyces sp. JEL0801]|nr:hypothetical protein HDV02_001083 [Globomyces sp. JEL0801]